MARAYSQDLRERVIEAAVSAPKGVRQAAARFWVGVSTAVKWVQRAREDGDWSAHKQGRPQGSKLDAHRDFLLPLIEEAPDITIEDMQERLWHDLGVKAASERSGLCSTDAS